MTAGCEMELCPYWSGDGRVCPCALFGLDPPEEPRCELDKDDGVCLARLDARGNCTRKGGYHDEETGVWVEDPQPTVGCLLTEDDDSEAFVSLPDCQYCEGTGKDLKGSPWERDTTPESMAWRHHCGHLNDGAWTEDSVCLGCRFEARADAVEAHYVLVEVSP